MNTPRDRVIRALTHQDVDRPPRDLWCAPAVEARRGDEVAEILHRFPADIERADYSYPKGAKAKGTAGAGEWVDAWGCHFRAADEGGAAALSRPAVVTATDLSRFHPPRELLDRATLAGVNAAAAASCRFVLAWTEVRPLERLTWVRGESTLAELAAGAEAARLLAAVHGHFLDEVALWAQSDVDGVVIGDAWPAADGRSAAVWRQLLPLYRQYCELLHARDKFVFFLAPAASQAMALDLAAAGVDALYCDLASLDLLKVASELRGKVTFWGGADACPAFSFGTASEVRQQVDRIRRTLDYGRGGIIAQCHWSEGIGFNNVAAWLDAWSRPLPLAGPHFLPAAGKLPQKAR